MTLIIVSLRLESDGQEYN